MELPKYKPDDDVFGVLTTLPFTSVNILPSNRAVVAAVDADIDAEYAAANAFDADIDVDTLPLKEPIELLKEAEYALADEYAPKADDEAEFTPVAKDAEYALADE